MANLGSISTARLRWGKAAGNPVEKETFHRRAIGFQRFEGGRRGLASGMSCFSTVVSDSPTRVLNLLAI